jgi:hypothetical protein
MFHLHSITPEYGLSLQSEFFFRQALTQYEKYHFQFFEFLNSFSNALSIFQNLTYCFMTGLCEKWLTAWPGKVKSIVFAPDGRKVHLALSVPHNRELKEKGIILTLGDTSQTEAPGYQFAFVNGAKKMFGFNWHSVTLFDSEGIQLRDMRWINLVLRFSRQTGKKSSRLLLMEL